jgi:hypothetical protein
MSRITGKIIGMCLGDSHIDRHDRLTMKHCEKQKEYLDYKVKILQVLQKQPIWMKCYTGAGSQNGNIYTSWQIATRQRPIYRIIKKWMYRNGVKTITRKLLDKLDLEGVAIWFMDDGSTSFKRQNGQIHAVETTIATYISKEQNEIIVQYFLEKWGIKWGVNRAGHLWRIRCGTKESRKFCALIEPYVIPSMRYKIDKLLNKIENPTKD